MAHQPPQPHRSGNEGIPSRVGVAEHTCEIRWTGKRSRAEALRAAIAANDPDSFTISLSDDEDGCTMTVIVISNSLSSLKATVDDLLACFSAADSGLDVIDN